METFALFSLPHIDKISFVKGNVFYFKNTQNLADEIQNLGSGFLVHPFEISSLNEACFIKGNIEEWNGKNTFEYYYKNDIKNSTSQNEFVALTKKAIEDIVEGKSVKIVTSRTKSVEIKNDLVKIFQHLKSKFPNCFVCLFSDKKIGTWISASPEILLKYENHKGETFSMAGTKNKEEKFTEKEIIEQKIVTEYILETILKKHPGMKLNTTENEIAFGDIKHLLTRITMHSEDSLLPLAFALHPTPAVCGVKKNKAKDFILKNEKFDRHLYTGFWGPIFSSGYFEFFVNLRTMKINSPDNGTVYAGAGITRHSDAENEWKETERKTEIFVTAF